MKNIRVGSRESRLAVVQSEMVMDYIKEKGLSVDELTKATGIAKERFCSDQTVFSADEFMRICCYLQEDPYLFSIEDNAE